MKKFLFALLLALPFAFSAEAQQKIGIVNTNSIMEEMAEVKAATAKVQETAKQFDTEINRMQAELKTKVEAYQKEEATMTDVIKKRRQQELQEMESRITNSYQMMQEEIGKEQEKLMAPIRTRIINAINKVCEAQGCAYIFEAGSLLAVGSTALDLTQTVKNELGIKPAAAKPATTTPARSGARN